jgi:hypothetical protein
MGDETPYGIQSLLGSFLRLIRDQSIGRRGREDESISRRGREDESIIRRGRGDEPIILGVHLDNHHHLADENVLIFENLL